jgi:hypothetical protein
MKYERWTKLQTLKSKPLENALIFKIRIFFLKKISFAFLSIYYKNKNYFKKKNHSNKQTKQYNI